MTTYAVKKSELIHGISKGVLSALEEPVKEIISEQITETLLELISEGTFYKELSAHLNSGIETLVQAIDKTKNDMFSDSQIREITDCTIPEASDQLEAIVRTTEAAALHIIEKTERLMSLNEGIAQEMKEPEGNGEDHTPDLATVRGQLGESNALLMEIMTDLSFQDLTGQRIQKIVKLVRLIETKLKRFLEAVESSVEQHASRSEVVKQPSNGSDIVELTGPSDTGFKQEDVDDLLTEFGL